ncbi:OmpP1/FadL family transporter [Paracoccus sulfuroxidans]|uniref:Long-subunit fatty acid transport protein n=1 Tax=Paracoccus sulfuroxidans TaxID=384678 RepID=A0A562NSE6_9RHOB|nr:outer membrane protein transport protein [Paracoccus sulfuroxidans]TWI34990.1 long-subunit fatty acid transport protein [Paracoccus sulfuroxidans]
MKRTFTSIGALLVTAAPVLAGGIERAPQSLAPMFEKGNYVEFSFGGVDPSVSGRDLIPGVDARTGDVAKGYGFAGISYKHQFNDNLSGVFIMEQPFGADIRYDSSSMMLGGTSAKVDSTTYTALLRYKFENNFSVHGGIRGSHAEGEVNLSGLAYGPISGYNVKLDNSWGFGWVAGVAYEIPEIAARVSLTYNSPIEHEFDTHESSAFGTLDDKTKVKTPRSWTLEGQTGIAEDTLLFGSIRWVNWSEFRVRPTMLVVAPPNGFGVDEGLVALEDTTTYTIGVGRKFNDNWSGTVSFLYEPSTGDDMVSPLAPTNGRKAITVAAIYTRDNMKITTGVNYTKLGSADPETGTPDVARARMRDSDAWGVGVRVGYSF